MSKKGKINSLGNQYIGASASSDTIVNSVQPSAIFAVAVMLLMMLV